MSVGSADIQEGLVGLWNDSGLDAKVKALWAAGVDHDAYLSLHDTEATPGQPFPYVVYELEPGRIIGRMSGKTGTGQKYMTREIPCKFTVHAEKITGDERSAKQIAAYIAEEIMKVFGGHPTETSQLMNLTHGADIGAYYVSDWSVRTDLYKWSWVVNELLFIDAVEAE